MSPPEALSLLPFVPSGKDYDGSRRLFAELGFDLEPFEALIALPYFHRTLKLSKLPDLELRRDLDEPRRPARLPNPRLTNLLLPRAHCHVRVQPLDRYTLYLADIFQGLSYLQPFEGCSLEPFHTRSLHSLEG